MDHEHEIVIASLYSKPPVLRSESVDEYGALLGRIIEEFRPDGAIQSLYVEEITYLAWEMKRLRRAKVNTIHQMSRQALQNMLGQIAWPIDNDKHKALSYVWFENNPFATDAVSEIFMRFNIDESAIEAEAINLAAERLKLLDNALISASSRLDKSLRFLGQYGAVFADELQRRKDRLLPVTAQRPDA